MLAKNNIDEIPINQDAVTRFVPMIMALLVFLLSLVLAGAFSISSSLKNWHVGASHKLTIEVPLQHELDRERMIPNIVTFLQSVPGINHVEPIKHQQLLSLLEPWVGQAEMLSDVPVPALIDIDVDPNAHLEVPELIQKLRQYAAGVRIESHSRWLETLLILRTSLQVVAYLFALIIAMTVAITVMLVTKVGLASHYQSIAVLRLMGAHNSYIARKFQAHALKLASKGALIGFLAAFPVLIGLNYVTSNFGVPEMLRPTADLSLIALLVIIPFIIIGLSILVARFAVLKTLIKLD
ncbi:cell division protein FtsX [Candidatus Paracaedibacter symbiosus]|uniref:cell division protein FtsX n=1 Tax=Candidatus Paracaedibacter symbiosus TaxID=244582 RepID=UPI000509994B|nr:FtsX-like permease family protein [Candidatus Paracaedibacter symbiosus]